MTFDTDDKSVQLSQPIDLYTFQFATGSPYRYASGDIGVTYPHGILVAQTWAPSPVRRAALQVVGGAQDDTPTMTIELPINDPVIALYAGVGVPPQTLKVTIDRYQVNSGALEQVATGYVTQCQFRGGRTAVLTIASIDDAPLQLQIPKFALSKTCNHVLYDRYCQVTRAAIPATIAAIAGRVLTITSSNRALAIVGSQAFVYGELQHTGTKERRTVVAMSIPVGGTPKTVTLDVVLPSSVRVGDALTLYAGCDHTTVTCRNTFNNVANFGGHPHILDATQFAKVTKTGAV